MGSACGFRHDDTATVARTENSSAQGTPSAHVQGAQGAAFIPAAMCDHDMARSRHELNAQAVEFVPWGTRSRYAETRQDEMHAYYATHVSVSRAVHTGSNKGAPLPHLQHLEPQESTSDDNEEAYTSNLRQDWNAGQEWRSARGRISTPVPSRHSEAGDTGSDDADSPLQRNAHGLQPGGSKTSAAARNIEISCVVSAAQCTWPSTGWQQNIGC